MIGSMLSPIADAFAGVWRDGVVGSGRFPDTAVMELLAWTGKMITRDLRIKNKVFHLQGDEVYLGSMGVEFEPHTVALLDSLCDVDSNIIDVGANIGLTSLAMTRTSPKGQIRAVEPVADAYKHLQANIELSQAINVSCFNFAAGRESSRVKMFVDDSNLASAFVTERNVTDEAAIDMRSLDDAFPGMDMGSVDFIKIDVEGFELEVLAGAVKLVSENRPRVLLEMNHWCLNVFHRISIPDFHDALMSVFPVVYAVDNGEVVDFCDRRNVGYIFEQHVLKHRFMDLVAGFDRTDMERRLAPLQRSVIFPLIMQRTQGFVKLSGGELGGMVLLDAVT